MLVRFKISMNMSLKNKKNEIESKPRIRKEFISVRGANQHNLKNVSVDIPHNKLTVVTGVSGSGKSTLAFDTIYAEGQRRFVESLSAYARQFLERMNKPDVESINGLPPAVAIEQRKPSKNPRSTVGTTTEIYDYLRLIYGRIGITKCKSCGNLVKKDNPESIINDLLKLPEDSKLYILSPLDQQVKQIEMEFNRFAALGFFRYTTTKVNEFYDFDDTSHLTGLTSEDILIIIDRIILRNDEDSKTRLADSIELAFRISGGRIKVKDITTGLVYNYSAKFECADCDIVYQEPEPRLFSFNNPFGACPTCQGFGKTMGINEDLVIPDKTKTIRKGAVAPFQTPKFTKYQRDLISEPLLKNLRLDVPVYQLTKEEIDLLWDGAGNYEGINGFFKMLEENNYKMQYRILTNKYRGYTRCRSCGGSRLRTSARQVYIGGKNIPELVRIPVNQLLVFLNELTLTENELQIVGQVVRELKWRIGLLVDIGLHYLTLDRLSHSLSGGEGQRINLSSALGSSLVGTLYVLDEPSIGMHPRDTNRLLNILFKLRSLGNTIIVVEHDPDIIRKADYIVDIGPKAGENGGNIVFSGNFDELMKSNNTLTAKYLSGEMKIPMPAKRNPGFGQFIEIIKPRENNLKMDSIRFPLGCMVVMTGVSGSGKSTLIHNILYNGIKKLMGSGKDESGKFENINGIQWIDNIEIVDQSSIGKSSRSTPVTYTKVFDYIRDIFASTQHAKQLGWRAGFFSFNVPGGRCEVCEGGGTVTVNMQFLPDLELECEACKGTRYKKEARSILYKGKSIIDILNMTIDEALEFFKDSNKIKNKLTILQEVGLGYLKLGQPSSMLSGGESQRIKLASHLESDYDTRLLYIFDEPTTGLHLDDISKLLKCFQRIVEKGHSVIIIEHNLNIIAAADWIIDLGPEAGDEGGMIVGEGTPEQIVKLKNSYTGAALKEFFQH